MSDHDDALVAAIAERDADIARLEAALAKEKAAADKWLMQAVRSDAERAINARLRAALTEAADALHIIGNAALATTSNPFTQVAGHDALLARDKARASAKEGK